MRTVVWLVLLVAGCDRVFSLDPLHPQPPDAPVEILPDARMCFGAGRLQLCLVQPATDPLDVSSGTMTQIDTDNAPCAAYTGGEPGLCVIAATQVQIDGTLRGVGGKPLVLVATTTVTITGKIDLSGNPAGRSAAADPAECTSGTSATGGGGGAGGSFGGRGGNGANGNGSTNASTAGAAVTPTRLRGGCSGKVGSNGGGGGGHAGGAVAMLAGDSITIDGVIDASGSFGYGGPPSGSAMNPAKGGGGGGSGGMIELDAPILAIGPAGSVFANGGGGGEGGGNPAAGNDGKRPTDATIAAPGGASGTSNGGDGGDGSVGAMLDGGRGSDGTATGGGGAGGGAAGVIHVVAVPTGGRPISPPPS
jgi:hypothetical protein